MHARWSSTSELDRVRNHWRSAGGRAYSLRDWMDGTRCRGCLGGRLAFQRAVRSYEEVGSAPGTGLAFMGLAAVEAAAGRSELAVQIAAAAAGALVARWDRDSSIPWSGRRRTHRSAQGVDSSGTLDGIVANASVLTPAAVLAMVAA